MHLHHAWRRLARPAVLISALVMLGTMAWQTPALASPPGSFGGPGGPGGPGAAWGRSPRLVPGNLLVSTSNYQNDPNIQVGTPLPPGCGTTSYNTPCGDAVANGAYPYVFNNDSVDGSFGVTSKIVLDELTPWGRKVGSLEVPNSSEPGVTSSRDQMVTSFSSKSELALNLSPDGKYVTFMGYNSPVSTTDASNANTPGAIDPTNPVTSADYRVVAELGPNGKFHFTETNAYSGDNGRAAIADEVNGHQVLYTAGNAGNGANPEPPGVVLGTGAQLVQPSPLPESQQDPGTPTPIGSFNVMQQLGYPSEKIAKDNNFRGMAINNNVLYYTKGSGSNGVNTVYFVDTTGKACPDGVGLPQPGAALPTTALTENPTEGGSKDPGLTPQNMCILQGFPTASAKNANDASDYPFGMWFANPDTLYIADEGSGDNTYSATNGQYTAAAASTTAGLQKWVFNSQTQSWNLAYTLQSGLNLGQPYTVPGYPTGDNTGPGGTNLPWSPATDGLRALTGRVNPNGTVSLWAVTSTVSGSGDQGADPDRLVSITDPLAATTPAPNEHFQTVQTAAAGQVLRGVSFTPGTHTGPVPGHGMGLPPR